VLLIYWTAFADAERHVTFAPDIYERDARLLHALDGPVRGARTTTDPVAGRPQ
jgi:murein L,D-transpeptidase YcbB/YkuD